ncbi:helix-turn-helix transcriptional regulator [Gordonia sp. FQ]|uniref:helix-turn-helix transcriptional regulator n=1 Tax=Gordonia sp. FQ TaxID=3446634 RepID=UPI003F8680B1
MSHDIPPPPGSAPDDARLRGALSPAEAGRYIGDFKVTTLERWRKRGIGPAYVQVNGKSIVYRVSDLDEWLAANVVRPGESGGAV